MKNSMHKSEVPYTGMEVSRLPDLKRRNLMNLETVDAIAGRHHEPWALMARDYQIVRHRYRAGGVRSEDHGNENYTYEGFR